MFLRGVCVCVRGRAATLVVCIVPLLLWCVCSLVAPMRCLVYSFYRHELALGGLGDLGGLVVSFVFSEVGAGT